MHISLILFALTFVVSPITSFNYNFNPSDSLVLFNEWMKTHRKYYNSLDEIHNKFDVFCQNLHYVNHQNSLYDLGLSSWKATINTSSADLTPEQFSQLYLGYNSFKTHKWRINASGEKQLTNNADSVNWVKSGAVTEIKDQGQCGSCYIFSAVGAIESLVFLKTGNLTSLSEQQVLDCDNVDDHCNGGLMENVFNYVHQSGGLETEKDYKYRAEQGSQCRVVSTEFVLGTNLTGFVEVTPNNQTAFLDALAERPLSIAIDASALQFYDSGVIDQDSCGTNLDHGVLAVGYDTKSDPPYILVKNSWGSYFGENGYFRLSLSTSSNNGTCGAYMDVSYPVS